jgi:tetratricopeptide (TPR) repeat protein
LDDTFLVNLKLKKRKIPPSKSKIAVKNENISKKKLSVTTTKKGVLKKLIKKFNTKNSYYLAIMIAKEYYSRKRYKESLKWALKANEIDNKKEESWVLFAKSSAKIGKREDAITVLKAFLKNNSSQKAEMLLEEITNGEFK